MVRGQDPLTHDRVELFCRSACVRRRDQLENRVLAARERVLRVTREHGFERRSRRERM